ncbi:MAG: ABC transporter ATP-binding protein [Candidatus Rokuibacteriota bacterium]|nr:MAG: ABC transporter ATP-binding protein [Candidatus Rokubacteria bacterium]
MLEVERIDVFYGLVPALSAVSLRVDAGETVCLLGPNGAGKTTTVRSILGLLRPRAGRIRFHDVDITGRAPHETVALGLSLAPEGRLLFPEMSVEENLELGASTPRARGRAHETKDRVYALFPRLDARRRQAAGTLSGGEQQMVTIGRALMAGPELLILDEPSLGLSPLLVQELFRVLRTLNEQGMSILVVEQNVVQALGISHRAYVLESGKVVMEGTSDELRRSDTIRQSYLGM